MSEQTVTSVQPQERPAPQRLRPEEQRGIGVAIGSLIALGIYVVYLITQINIPDQLGPAMSS